MKLEQIVADGTQLKSQIAELQEMEQKSQSTFEQFKADDLVRYQSEIDALNRKREQLQAAAAQQNMQRQQNPEQLRTHPEPDRQHRMRHAEPRGQ
ncbi:MAG: hypothetical protein ACLU3I_08245 [Acutalibacteraceae bacterium]